MPCECRTCTCERVRTARLTCASAALRGASRGCARSVLNLHVARPVLVNTMTTAFDGSGNAVRRVPPTCDVCAFVAAATHRPHASHRPRVQPHRIVRRCIFRVARRRGRDGVCARAQRADQAAPQASSIKSHSLCTARLTRRWFLAIRSPWRSQGRTLLWPHAVAMHVSWDVLRAALPGSNIFGQHVRPNSAWQHMLVASVHRGEMWPAEPMRDWHRRVPPAYYYFWRYVRKG